MVKLCLLMSGLEAAFIFSSKAWIRLCGNQAPTDCCLSQSVICRIIFCLADPPPCLDASLQRSMHAESWRKGFLQYIPATALSLCSVADSEVQSQHCALAIVYCKKRNCIKMGRKPRCDDLIASQKEEDRIGLLGFTNLKQGVGRLLDQTQLLSPANRCRQLK